MTTCPNCGRASARDEFLNGAVTFALAFAIGTILLGVVYG